MTGPDTQRHCGCASSKLTRSSDFPTNSY